MGVEQSNVWFIRCEAWTKDGYRCRAEIGPIFEYYEHEARHRIPADWSERTYTRDSGARITTLLCPDHA